MSGFQGTDVDRSVSVEASASQGMTVGHGASILPLIFLLKRNQSFVYTRCERKTEEGEAERGKRYKTDGAMGGVVCLEFVPKDVANELLFVSAQS